MLFICRAQWSNWKTENCLNIEFNSQFQWVTFHSTRRGVVFLFYFISRPVKVELEPKLFFQTESRRLLPTHFLWNFMHTSKLSSCFDITVGKFHFNRFGWKLCCLVPDRTPLLFSIDRCLIVWTTWVSCCKKTFFWYKIDKTNKL